MDEPGEQDEKGLFRFTWTDAGKKDASKGVIVHLAFRRTRVANGTFRDFKLGDVITVKGAGGGACWVAHLVGLFEFDDVKGDRDMRCTLRWFYRSADFGARVLTEHAQVTSAREDEVFFSDLLEAAGTNHLSVVHGLAWLFETEKERRRIVRNPPERFQRGDPILFISCFSYKTSQIRNLDCGELKKLLENPDDTDDDLYSKSRPRMHAARGVAMKSTGGKHRNIALPPPEKKSPTFGSAGTSSSAGPSRTHGSTARKATGDRPTSAGRRETAAFAGNSPASTAAKQRRGRNLQHSVLEDDEMDEESSSESDDDGSNFSDAEPEVARVAKSGTGSAGRRPARRKGKAGPETKLARTTRKGGGGAGNGRRAGRRKVVVSESDESEEEDEKADKMGDSKESGKKDKDVGGGDDGEDSDDMQLDQRQARVKEERDRYRPRAPPVMMYSSLEIDRRRERANGTRPAAGSVGTRRQAVEAAGNSTRCAAGSSSSGGGYETVEASGNVLAENTVRRRPRAKVEGATEVIEASGRVFGSNRDRHETVEASGNVVYNSSASQRGRSLPACGREMVHGVTERRGKVEASSARRVVGPSERRPEVVEAVGAPRVNHASAKREAVEASGSVEEILASGHGSNLDDGHREPVKASRTGVHRARGSSSNSTSLCQEVVEASGNVFPSAARRARSKQSGRIVIEATGWGRGAGPEAAGAQAGAGPHPAPRTMRSEGPASSSMGEGSTELSSPNDSRRGNSGAGREIIEASGNAAV